MLAIAVLSTSEETKHLERQLLKLMARASHEHRLLEPGDRVLVAVSGGKDSHVLLHLLREIQKKAPFKFSLLAVNIEHAPPGSPASVLPSYLGEQGYEYHVVNEDTWSIVRDKIQDGKSHCSLCSRLRRGILYTTAKRLGATKIALGHHRDDSIETLLLNAFFAGQMRAMPARLRSSDGANTVIRPLIYCAEADIAAYASGKGFPIVPCVCGSLPHLQRRRIKELLSELEREIPHIKSSLFSATTRVRASHLLDRDLISRLGESDAVESDDLDG